MIIVLWLRDSQYICRVISASYVCWFIVHWSIESSYAKLL